MSSYVTSRPGEIKPSYLLTDQLLSVYTARRKAKYHFMDFQVREKNISSELQPITFCWR